MMMLSLMLGRLPAPSISALLYYQWRFFLVVFFSTLDNLDLLIVILIVLDALLILLYVLLKNNPHHTNQLTLADLKLFH
jgi:hypothetical protein